MSSHISTEPDALVDFYYYTHEKTRGADNVNEIRRLRAHRDLMEVHTSKAKGKAGTFTMVLSPTTNWKARLKAGDWCCIWMSDERYGESDSDSTPSSDQASGLKMVGIVRNVKVSRRTEPGGRKTTRYIVSGTDFHHVLDIPIFVAAILSPSNGADISVTTALQLGGLALSSSVGVTDTVRTLRDQLLGFSRINIGRDGKESTPNNLEFLIKAGRPYLVPPVLARRIFGTTSPSGAFHELMISHFQEDLVGKRLETIPVIGNGATPWGMMHSYCNGMVNEMYTELLPLNQSGITRLVPSLVLRAIPFSRKRTSGQTLMMQDAKDRPELLSRGKSSKPVEVLNLDPETAASFYVSKHIKEEDIMADSSSKSDAERFNFFYVPPNLANSPIGELLFSTSALEGSLSNIADTASIARNGLKPFSIGSNYFISPTNLFNKMAQDIWEEAYLYEPGMLQIRGSASHIPCGTNVEFTDRGWIAHVEQVDNSFVVSESGIKSFRTNISFVRLQMKDTGRPVDITEDNIGTPAHKLQKDWEQGFTDSNRGGK